MDFWVTAPNACMYTSTMKPTHNGCLRAYICGYDREVAT